MKSTRILEEGFGGGAWHGPDLKAALADVTAATAHWRPTPDRHSIAEIAVHHAYCVRSVRGQLSGRDPEPFPLKGEDWFPLSNRTLAWERIRGLVEEQQVKLGSLVADLETGKVSSPLGADEREALILGITGHAIYHAGQIQLLKRLQ